MDFEHELQRIADMYRDQGYEVAVRPRAEQLPPFATDFRVELVGRRGVGGVLVAVRKNRDALVADNDLTRYAEVTGGQPGWRFDLAVVEPSDATARDVRGGRELSGDEIARSLEQADELGRSGHPQFAVVAAWAGLEAAMRLRLRASGREAGWGSKPREMVRELYSAGALTPDEFRQVELASQLRTQIVHGFAPQPANGANPQTVTDQQLSVMRAISDLTSRLVNESQTAALPA